MQSNLKREIAQVYFNRKANRLAGIAAVAFVVGYFGAHVAGYFIFFAS